MAGVDHFDHLMSRFSVVKGHSYKRWHTKMAFIFVDMARTNAYSSWKIVHEAKNKRKGIPNEKGPRDPHRDFVMNLSQQLISGAWRNTVHKEFTLLGISRKFNNPFVTPFSPPPKKRGDTSFLSPAGGTPTSGRAPPPDVDCVRAHSKDIFGDADIRIRNCVVCSWEDRGRRRGASYCMDHEVSLCPQAHDTPDGPGMYPGGRATCWEKFHYFYQKHGLVGKSRRMKRGSRLYKARYGDKENASPASTPRIVGPPPELTIYV
jgi:hypothetical protein